MTFNINFCIVDLLQTNLTPGDIVPVYPDPSFPDEYWLVRIVSLGKIKFEGMYLEKDCDKNFITGGKCSLYYKTIFKPKKKRVYKVVLEEVSSHSKIGVEADRFLKSFAS